MKKISEYLRLNAFDLLKGGIVASISAVFSYLITILDNHQIPTTWNEWKYIGIVVISSFISYLIKNIFTNSKGELLKK